MPDTFDLNAPSPQARLEALRRLTAAGAPEASDGAPRPGAPDGAAREVNCHVHTIYSFSPYSPSAAVERARAAGLAAVGIMDHDSVAGAAEMRAAGAILGIATTQGVELRVSMAGTALAGRKLNNPDSDGIMYMSIHGLPARGIPAAAAFLEPIHAAREARDRLMVERLNLLLGGSGLRPVDWERDVRGRSQAAGGGSVTERHVLAAAAAAILEKTGPGAPLVAWLADTLGIRPGPRVAGWLSDASNGMALFDLLGVLKSSFMDRIYVQPGAEECVPVAEAVSLAERTGGIPTYAYLGDVTDSPTGDKKAERYEDSFLDELMPEIRRLGFRAVTYMPPRNTLAQLLRVQRLCAEHGFMEVSGVDINSPRQSFNCPELRRPEFSHLLDATWALIAHERLSDADPRLGLFSPANPLAAAPLGARIAAYARAGTLMDPSDTRPVTEHPSVRSLVASWG
jgi:hypothetical protein